MSVTWTEHRTNQLRCRHSRSRTNARLPGQIARSGFGPRFRAAVVNVDRRLSGLASGGERACPRPVRRPALGRHDRCDLPARNGGLAGPHLQLQDWVLDQDAVHVDETGWRTRGAGRALWTATTPRRSDSLVHVILDNSSTHKTPAIQTWLAGHPRFVLHFTPTSSSWLNLVERWFAEPTNKRLRRGTHRFVHQLNADIRAWIDTWNENPRPFVWTKTADEILESIARYCTRINESRH